MSLESNPIETSLGGQLSRDPQVAAFLGGCLHAIATGGKLERAKSGS
jgi:hypothetical protein